jgi:exosortase/archaeosortase family protein
VGERRRFALALVAALVFVVGLRLAEPAPDRILAGANRLTAATTAALLRVSGLEVERVGSVVRLPEGFGFYVYHLCAGWPLAVVLSIGLVGLPGRPAGRLAAGALGVAALLIVNQLRLVSLFWIGSELPGLYGAAHRFVWEPAMLLCVGSVWALWLARPRPRLSGRRCSS